MCLDFLLVASLSKGSICAAELHDNCLLVLVDATEDETNFPPPIPLPSAQ